MKYLNTHGSEEHAKIMLFICGHLNKHGRFFIRKNQTHCLARLENAKIQATWLESCEVDHAVGI